MTKKIYQETNNWKDFYLHDLFDIDNGNKLDLNKMIETPVTDIAFVSRTASNNGVSSWVELKDGVEPYPAGCITVALGGSIGSTFVQPRKFYTGQNVAVLKPNRVTAHLTIEDKLLIALLIKKECDTRFIAFGRELNKHIKTDLSIRLPVLQNNDVDWVAFRKISQGVLSKLSIKTSNTINPFASINNWKYFRIKDIFWTNKKGKLPRGKVHSKEELIDGTDFFYVGAKKRDNGIMYRCGFDENQMSKGNCIVFICNGQGSVGYTNYIDKDFMASGDIALGYNKNLNKYNALFLVTILDKERFKYSYGRKWGKYLAETTILLPAKNDTTPDWTYMENYIKGLPYGDRI